MEYSKIHEHGLFQKIFPKSAIRKKRDVRRKNCYEKIVNINLEKKKRLAIKSYNIFFVINTFYFYHDFAHDQK